MKREGLSLEEFNEYMKDACEAFSEELINEEEFRERLASLGLNATEIEDHTQRYRPPAPEEHIQDED